MSGPSTGIGGPSGLPGDGEQPAWVAAALGDDIRSATRARWGFRHETWLVKLGGERLVVQRRADRSDPMLPPHPAIRRIVRDSGLPVPEPARVTSAAGDVVVVLPYADGIVAAELLRGGEDAGIVGRACGWVASRLATVDLSAVAQTLTSGPGATAAAVTGDGDRFAGGSDRFAGGSDRFAGGSESFAGDSDRFAGDLDRLPRSLREGLQRYLDQALPRRDEGRRVVAHGDLAPVNILVRDDRVVAVLDLDRARPAHREYDAAWFAWVVITHHPELAPDAWRGYAEAAGLPGRSMRDVSWLWPLQLLERVREAATVPERDRWLGHLAAALMG